MTTTVIRSPRANVEIEEIAEYLARHSLPAARRFREALQRAQQQLSQSLFESVARRKIGGIRYAFPPYIEP